MSRFTEEQLDDLFTHHPPSPDQVKRYDTLRKAARKFAQVIVDNTPGSGDQSAAIRELRICLMTANAAIALEK